MRKALESGSEGIRGFTHQYSLLYFGFCASIFFIIIRDLGNSCRNNKTQEGNPAQIRRTNIMYDNKHSTRMDGHFEIRSQKFRSESHSSRVSIPLPTGEQITLGRRNVRPALPYMSIGPVQLSQTNQMPEGDMLYALRHIYGVPNGNQLSSLSFPSVVIFSSLLA